MKLFDLRSPGVAREGDGIDVRARLCKLPETIARCLKPLLSSYDIEVDDNVHFEDRLAAKSLLIDGADLHGTETISQSISQDLNRKFHESIQRLTEAYRQQVTLVRTNGDRQAIHLNQAAWDAANIGAELWFLPGSPYEWRLYPVDPAGLQCAAPVEIVNARIDAAEVIGTREIRQKQRDLWGLENMIDIVISLDHKIAEIRHRTTRSKAQALWEGLKRISVEICIRPGELPEVVGELIDHTDQRNE